MSSDKEIKKLTNSMAAEIEKDNEIYLKGLGKDVILSYEAKVEGKNDFSIYKNTFHQLFGRVKIARKHASEFARNEFKKYSNVSSVRFVITNRDGKEIENFTFKSA